MSNRIQRIHGQGQSIWCDNLSRQMIKSGELKRLIGLGIVGITSNPTIFMKAITGGHDYDEQFQQLLDEGEEDLVTIYERLVVPDIAAAADILRPVYERTNRVDGFVSLEVNPKLAYDTQATVAEARRLFGDLDRPNIFIKVPATPEGIPAIETLIGEGINVNVTLIFSIDVHREVMRAYLNGLKRLSRAGGDVSTVASVASFFVSRVDTLVDKLLEKKRGKPAEVDKLMGKAAVANAKLAYAAFEEMFSGAGDFGALASKGARVQRPLWASTSTKNPEYSDTMYVDPLIGPHTVNTLPPQTIDAVLDHAATEPAITKATDESRATFRRLADVGIDMKDVTDQLTREGVDAFIKSFDEILENLGQKQEQLRAARA
jgi:transaldolase